MPTAKKEASVAELKDLVERASIVIGTEYRGLTVREVTTLRRALREAGVEVARRQEQAVPARRKASRHPGRRPGRRGADHGRLRLRRHRRARRRRLPITRRRARNAFAPKKAYLDGAVVAGSIIAELASLPSREQLIAKLAGAFMSPMQTFVNQINDSMQTFARLIEARASQLEEAA